MVKLSTPRPVKAVITYPSRALDTVYQNTTGRPKLCIVSVYCSRANVATAKAIVNIYVDDVTPPTDWVGDAGLVMMSSVPEIIEANVVFMVPNNFYYKLASDVAGAGSSVGVTAWTEVEL